MSYLPEVRDALRSAAARQAGQSARGVVEIHPGAGLSRGSRSRRS